MSNVKTSTMLAVWNSANNKQYWHRDDTSRGMWLELRSVDQEHIDGTKKVEINLYGVDGFSIRNAGLYCWAGTGGGVSVELRAHDIHSADARELTAIAKWLTAQYKKIEKAALPRDFPLRETIILTLRAMGIRSAVKIDGDWRSNDHKVISVEDALALPNYGGPLAEMEAMRQRHLVLEPERP